MAIKGTIRVSNLIATVGVVLIAVGVIWFLAYNWHAIPSAIKILNLVVATSVAFFAGWILEPNYRKIGHTMYMLTAILWTVSLYLIAQIFNVPVSFQANANILGLALLGTLLLAYIINSTPVLVIAGLIFEGWVWLQTTAEVIPQSTGRTSLHLLIINQLGVTGILFGLALLHRGLKIPDFARVYIWWAAFSFLYLAFQLTHQASQYRVPAIWALGASTILPRLGIAVLFIVGGVFLSLRRGAVSKSYVRAGLIAWLSYVAAVGMLPSLIVVQRGVNFVQWPQYNPQPFWQMTTPFIVQWLLFNGMFILLVLLVLTFAMRERHAALMHLGIWFFMLYLLVRYIGFILDLRGYLAISMLFILGGIGLILLAVSYAFLHRRTLRRLVTERDSATNV